MMNTYRWDLGGQVHALHNIAVARLERAFEIHVGNLLAEIGLGRQELNEAVLDADLDFSSLFDLLLDRAARRDEELLAAVFDYVSSGFVCWGTSSRGYTAALTPWEDWGRGRRS